MISFREYLNEYYVSNTASQARSIVKGLYKTDSQRNLILSSHDLGNGYTLHKHKTSNKYLDPHVVTVTKDGKQVGGMYARYDHDRKAHYVEAVHVDKQHRKKGLGAAMYNDLLQSKGAYVSDHYISKEAEEHYKRQHAKGKVTFHDNRTHEEVPHPKDKHTVYMKVHP